jgi:glutaredoxin
MNTRTVLTLGILFVVIHSAAQAEKLYKWVDKDGKVTYEATPPPNEGEYRVEEKRVRSGARGAGVAEDDPSTKFPVVLYTASQCASCDTAKAYLEKRKIPFSEKNVESDAKLQQELKKVAGALSVPTITVGEKVMKGYLESLLEGELDQAGYPKLGAAEAEGKETTK